MNRILVRVLLAAHLVACHASSDPEAAVPIEILVESDPGVPLGGAHVTVDGRFAGKSDLNGFLRPSVATQSGATVRIEHDCPDGYLEPDGSKVLRMREYQGLGHDGAPALQISLRCKPEKRRAVFVVRARGAARLPVLLDGEPVAQTNRFGVAQFSALGAPGAEYLVKIDTGGSPALLPRSPSHLFALSDANEVFVIDQAFRRETPPKRGRSGRKRILKIE